MFIGNLGAVGCELALREARSAPLDSKIFSCCKAAGKSHPAGFPLVAPFAGGNEAAV
jgi:hypothetical protein